MTILTRGLPLAAILAALLPTSAPAQEETNRVATESDWVVFEGASPKECWAVTAPKETTVTQNGQVVAARRGDILLFVTFRPEENVAAEVSFTGGYPFADGSTATLAIGGTTFEMFTEGEYAWPTTPNEDQKIVAALKSGSDAVVTAQSSRGKTTKDTFSLLGATAMIEEAERRCAEQSDQS